MDYFEQIDGTLWIRTPSGKMEGVFILYQTDEDDNFEGSIGVSLRDESSLDASISVRVQTEEELNSAIEVKYRGNEELDATFDVVGSAYLESSIEVRANNRMFGIFELLPPPRVERLISSTEDSTTRSRVDLMTINYGDSKRMMISDGEEHLESFVKFGDLERHFDDLAILEQANLRLYYTGGFVEGTNVGIHLPDTRWGEYGITHANKPNSVELITSEYTINKTERYIEFNIMPLVQRWLSGDTPNFGVIIKSNSEVSTSFNTRETDTPPSISVRFISSKVYSLGRAELESTMFIWGIGNPELNATLEVHSDWGFENLDGELYVHRPEVPLEEGIDGLTAVTRPDLNSTIAVAIRDYDEQLEGKIAVWGIGGIDGEIDTSIAVNKPDLNSWLAVDPNVSLKSHLIVRKAESSDLVSAISVTREAIDGQLIVKDRSYLDASLTVQRDEAEDLDSFLGITRPEIMGHLSVKVQEHNDEFNGYVDVRGYLYLDSTFAVTREAIEGFLTLGRVWDEDNLESAIEVPNYEHLEATLAVTREDAHGYLTVHHYVDLESSIWVKDKEYMDSFITVNETSELEGFINIIYKETIDSTLAVSRREIHGYFWPRVIGDDDLWAEYWVRQRDASDLDSILTISGAYGAYYFII